MEFHYELAVPKNRIYDFHIFHYPRIFVENFWVHRESFNRTLTGKMTMYHANYHKKKLKGS